MSYLTSGLSFPIHKTNSTYLIGLLWVLNEIDEVIHSANVGSHHDVIKPGFIPDRIRNCGQGKSRADPSEYRLTELYNSLYLKGTFETVPILIWCQKLFLVHMGTLSPVVRAELVMGNPVAPGLSRGASWLCWEGSL